MKRVENAVETSLVNYIAPCCKSKFIELQAQVSRIEKQNCEFDAIGIRTDGSQFRIHIAISQLRLVEGIINFVLFSEPVDCKKSKTKLSSHEMYLANIANNFNFGFLIFDLSETRFLYVNKSLERMTGFPAEEFYSNPQKILKEMIHQDDLGSIISRWRINKCAQVEYRIITSKNEIRWHCGCQYKLRDEETGNHHIMIAVTDITEAKLAAEKEVLYQNQLLQADKLASLGLLVSGIVHEINNPNNYISLSAPLLRKAWDCVTPLFSRYKEDIEKMQIGSMAFSEFSANIDKLFKGIEGGSQRIKRIVSEIKNYSCLDNENNKSTIDLNMVVKSAVDLMEPMIKKSTKFLFVELSEQPLELIGNSQRLEQVVINIIHNACDALTDTNQSISITTHLCDCRTAEIIIKDTGCGIITEHMEKIQEPFFTTKQHKGGTGLGLSVCSRIINDHKGEMKFKSEPGKGTTVTLVFRLE